MQNGNGENSESSDFDITHNLGNGTEYSDVDIAPEIALPAEDTAHEIMAIMDPTEVCDFVVSSLLKKLGIENEGFENLVRLISSIKKASELRNIIKILNNEIILDIDPDLAFHNTHVANFASSIATKIGLENRDLLATFCGGLLHDIGKLIIPSTVRCKVGAYNEAERKIMQNHSLYGYLLLNSLGLAEKISRIVLNHHERIDGSGYPRGIRDLSIPTQILGVADMGRSMMEDREYHNGSFSIDQVVQEFQKAKDQGLFDQKIIDAAIEILLSIPKNS